MQRYRQWLQEWGSLVSRYIQKSILGLLAYKILEDRLMGWANQTIDSTVSSPAWIDSIKSALLWFDSTGLGFYWNLVALTFLAILLIAYTKTQQQPSPDPQPPENETPGDAEQKRRLLLLIHKLGDARSRMQQMANQVHGMLGKKEGIERHLVRASLYFMKPLETAQNEIIYFLRLDRLSHKDFIDAQFSFVTLYNIYEERRSWVRDIGWYAYPNLSSSSFYQEWEKADRDMRQELKELLPNYPVFSGRIIGLELSNPWWWEQKPWS
jgi:hypothetical protein